MPASPPSRKKGHSPDGSRKTSLPEAVSGLCRGPHIGVDEAGRGCLAGPVVAAAAFFPLDFAFPEHLPGLTDSKQLSEKQRQKLAEGVSLHASAYGIGLSWQEEIDAVNILNATFRAMSRAVQGLAASLAVKNGDPASSAPAARLPALLIDGNKTIHQAQWETCFEFFPAAPAEWQACLPLPLALAPGPPFPLPHQQAVVDGDALIPSISAASVLAKTFRDRLMAALDACFPGYEMARHKGYGTKAHLALLAQKGPCALHRKTFRRVRPEEEQYRLF